jgi:hypothetical protein
MGENEKRGWHHGLLSFCSERTKLIPGNPFPLLEEMQDQTWKPHDLTELLRFMNIAQCALASSGGKRMCHVCGLSLGLGADWRTDGEFGWPKDLAHYVEYHHVRLPDAFVERIRALDYQPPTPAPDALDTIFERAGLPTMRKPKADPQ